jgi:hypothetical protein
MASETPKAFRVAPKVLGDKRMDRGGGAGGGSEVLGDERMDLCVFSSVMSG